ncbi:MAG TPA: hypothetical protein VJ951_13995 [Bacteroidales bacterium]|nr:hypothetical protein [Bacteroidales bacterium]
MEKFRGKYSVSSHRAQWWDYSEDAAYFITICTINKELYFGEIANQNMCLSAVGKIARRCWREIPNHFSHVSLGAFIVMPNHIHGILILNGGNKGSELNSMKNENINVETRLALSLQNKNANNLLHPGNNRFQNMGKNSVSAIVGSYKSAVTKQANRKNLPNGWQPLFYDRIIRSKTEFNRIERYIFLNPLVWKDEDFYK